MVFPEDIGTVAEVAGDVEYLLVSMISSIWDLPSVMSACSIRALEHEQRKDSCLVSIVR